MFTSVTAHTWLYNQKTTDNTLSPQASQEDWAKIAKIINMIDLPDVHMVELTDLDITAIIPRVPVSWTTAAPGEGTLALLPSRLSNSWPEMPHIPSDDDEDSMPSTPTFAMISFGKHEFATPTPIIDTPNGGTTDGKLMRDLAPDLTPLDHSHNGILKSARAAATHVDDDAKPKKKPRPSPQAPKALVLTISHAHTSDNNRLEAFILQHAYCHISMHPAVAAPILKHSSCSTRLAKYACTQQQQHSS